MEGPLYYSGEIERIDFIAGLVIVFILISTVLLYITSPAEIGEEEKKRVEKEAGGLGKNVFAENIKVIYYTLGGWAYWIADRFKFLYNLSPNTISWIGLTINVVASILIPFRFFSIAGFLLLLGGIFDIIDGKIARQKRLAKPSGALLDSFLDRISEISMFIGTIIFFSLSEQKISTIITAGALAFSLLVSYVRAKGESLGVSPREGIARREERVAVVSISLLLDSIFSYFTKKTIFLNTGILIIFIGTLITSAIRFRNVFRELKKSELKD